MGKEPTPLYRFRMSVALPADPPADPQTFTVNKLREYDNTVPGAEWLFAYGALPGQPLPRRRKKQ